MAHLIVIAYSFAMTKRRGKPELCFHVGSFLTVLNATPILRCDVVYRKPCLLPKMQYPERNKNYRWFSFHLVNMVHELAKKDKKTD